MHYNGANSYLFVNGTEIIRFKAIASEIISYSLCLGNMVNGYIHDFSTDCRTIATSDILDIHNCLMKKII